MRVRITGAKRIHAVEGTLRAAVPEIAVVEHRIDHWRRVARSRTANVDHAAIAVGDAPDGIGDAGFVFRCLPHHHIIEVEPEHTLRTHDVVVVAGRGMQREIAYTEHVVRTKARMENS